MTPYPKKQQTRRTMKPVEDGDFSNGTVTLVMDRDDDRCAWCKIRVTGNRGPAPWNWQVHHREPRQQGGTNDPHISRPSNGVLLHGTCHTYIENHRDEAEDRGFIVRRGERRSADVAIDHAVHGLVFLDDLGWFRRAEVTA